MHPRAAYAIAFAGVAVAVVLAWLPDREVVYSRQLTIVGCDQPEREGRCHAWARLSIGNTGNVDQALVRVRLPGAGAAWRLDVKSSDIRASRDARAEPRIARLDTGEAAVYEIRPLPRNTVVDLNAHCLACAEEAIRGMSAMQIAVESEGRAKEGDPRSVTLLRALGQLVSFLVPIR